MASRGGGGAILVTILLVFTVTAALYSYYKSTQQKKTSNSVVYSPNLGVHFSSTISKTTPGAFFTVMEALAAAPSYSDERYYIHIEAGIYEERVLVTKNLTNIVFVGDGKDSTKITFSRGAPDFSTSNSATVDIQGDGFLAMDIAFENTGGDSTTNSNSNSQSVAFMITSSESAFYRCKFLGFQDTLYAKRGNQFYRECDIYGSVDFIFGAAAAIFQSCNLYARLPKDVKFTAQSKDGSNTRSGFVLHNCTFTVAPEFEENKSTFEAYLGRPWSNYSTVVVMESFLDEIIQPQGWEYWENRTTDTLTYVEFGNRGPGSSTIGRVDWGGFKVVTDANDIKKYTVEEFLLAEKDWLVDTRIPYNRGLIFN